jgi:aspartate/glutamate racemase
MSNISQATQSAERIAHAARIAASKAPNSFELEPIVNECNAMHHSVCDASEDYADARLIKRCARVAAAINALDSANAALFATVRAMISGASQRAAARALSAECVE